MTMSDCGSNNNKSCLEPKGLRGPRGDKGAKGDKGDTGDTGLTGPQGPVGPAGPVGLQGSKGDTGERGLPGTAGLMGSPGLPGANGVNGTDGLDGAAGPKGPAGETGPQGPIGDGLVAATTPTGILVTTKPSNGSTGVSYAIDNGKTGRSVAVFKQLSTPDDNSVVSLYGGVPGFSAQTSINIPGYDATKLRPGDIWIVE